MRSMSVTIQQLRDEVAEAINQVDFASDKMILALRRLERDHKLDLPYNHNDAAHDVIDMMKRLDDLLEDIDQQLRERGQ